ncbi:MAG: hypothetical protein ACJ8C4_10895 [Gemmataceae bacterium]
MLQKLSEELGTRGVSTAFGVLLGGAIGWCLARWKRHRERVNIFAGDARDTVVIQQHIIESVPDSTVPGGRRATVIRIRSLGQARIDQVVPNSHLAIVLTKRAGDVTPTHSLISMVGPEGSYLLETLTGFVGDRIQPATFEHDTYVMTPCCEPQEISTHQPITILLVRVRDLEMFEHWPAVREVHVEHGGDGSRVITLMTMARKFREEQDQIVRLRREGHRTMHIETMYVLDLALDHRHADVPLKSVPWVRFESVLKQMGLE